MAETMIFYRYEYPIFLCDGVFLSKFILVRETPKGYWIRSVYGSTEKWVSKTGKKRYAYPTKEEALNYFIKKTELVVSIMENRLEFFKKSIEEAKCLEANLHAETVIKSNQEDAVRPVAV